ncbi:chondroitin AC/alginate lyase [Rhizoctonia solani]|uniref:Chondroitin AC/alginate lyase n=2 Tax=Rhizoctonia solani TaxID=456999 RepID=A0A8H8T177_9AGAM|nr:chondroitin AC/alginate lyase [Rhizoctonia solani]QRW24462.1 chondroitin AC/alginate lyase [Rhizoctonia solani]
MKLLRTGLGLVLVGTPGLVLGLTSYANEFITPEFFLAKNWSDTTKNAQDTIVQGAKQIATEGPWTVTSKTVMPPTNNTHDYLSWGPYYWPDCAKAGNTTQLTPEQGKLWTTCEYITRDGLFNPDVRQVNDTGMFQAMSDSVFFNSMAWVITGDDTYASNAAKEINTWFIDPATSMTPNLNYAQVKRGPGSQIGQHTGVLDLKCMSKLVSGVLMLRNGSAPAWTGELDSGLKTWVNSYIGWLTTNELALQEKAATNNHGSFYFNQLAALQILVDDTAGAKKTIQEYFEGIYQGQISANGDQPLETARTRPYHYRAYNLAAMIVNARIGEYVGYDAWQLKTKDGATIQDACNYAMTFTAAQSNETSYDAELYPNVAAVAAIYGDADGKYSKWLASRDASFPGQPYFLWDQPLSNAGLTGAPASGGNSNTPNTAGGNTGSNNAKQAGCKKGFVWFSSLVTLSLLFMG